MSPNVTKKRDSITDGGDSWLEPGLQIGVILPYIENNVVRIPEKKVRLNCEFLTFSNFRMYGIVTFRWDSCFFSFVRNDPAHISSHDV